MKISTITKTSKNILEHKIRSHGVIRIIRQNVADEFILSKEKLTTPMASYNFAPKIKNEHPSNLTNELQRVRYYGEEVKNLLKKNPDLSRTVGSLPQKWGRKIGKDKIYRQGIDDTFTEFAQKCHRGSITQKDIDFMQLKLSAILGTEVKISYLGQGYYGKTYKINADAQDYVLKVFFQNNVYGSLGSNGNYAELASAVYATKHEADKFATFYMGKFGKHEDGYILTKFIPENNPKIRYINGLDENSSNNFVFTKLIRKVEAKDSAKGNKLGEKVVDFGGITANNAIYLDSKTYILAKMIAKCLDMNNAKELDSIISKHKNKKEFAEAVGYIQELINTKCTRKNYKILENKKELLDKLNLDYIPDIRYILSGNRRFANDIINDSGLDVMYGISYRTFASLWEKYNKILQNLQKH